MKVIKRSVFLVLFILVFVITSGQIHASTAHSRYDLLKEGTTQEQYQTMFNEILDEKQYQSRENPESYRYYTWDIVDGGIYYIKNKSTGKYWTSPSVLGGEILMNAFGTGNQEFYVRYLGQDEYAFEPVQRNGERVRVTSLSSNVYSSTISYSSTFHRFRITALNSTDYRLSTKQSSFSSHLSSTYSSNSVLQTTNTDDSTRWLFEKKDDRVHDSAKAYYLKDTISGLYLTSTYNGVLTFKEFRGGEEQRFKRVVSYTEGTVTYAPLINTDRRVNSYGTGNMSASYVNVNINYQKFIEAYEGDLRYKISTYMDSSKFVSLGTLYSTNEYYVIKSSSSNSAIFEINEAQFITPFIWWKPYDTNNISYQSTNYAQTNVLCFEATYTGKYTFAMKRNVGTPIIGLFDQYGYYVWNSTVINGTNGQTIEANLEQGKIYYVYIMSVNNSEIFQYTSNLLKNITFYLHGMNTYINDNNDSNADRRTKWAVPSSENLNNKFLFEAVINTNADMSRNFVRNVDPITGYVPLRAPVYMFRGHGNTTLAQYSTGTNSNAGTTTFIRNTDFVSAAGNVNFDMSDSRFVAWIGCLTAGNVATGNNLTESTQIAGATSVLGFSKSISRAAANRFANNLVDEIMAGRNIGTAVSNAQSGITFWFTNLNSYVIEGSTTQVLRPSLGSGYVTRNSQIISEPNLSQYILEYETSLGVHRYVRYINGYPTNDYYDIHYDNDGNVTHVYESISKFNQNERQQALNLSSKFSSSFALNPSDRVIDEDMVFDVLDRYDSYDYIVKYKGELLPVRFFVYEYSNANGFTYLDIKAINMLNYSLMPEDILWENN